MVRTVSQCIPSAFKTIYRRALQRAATIVQGDYAKKRQPFRQPFIQGPKVSAAQLYVRSVFRDCVKCFEQQPDAGGATPPAVGPRDRSWWYNAATTDFPFYPHGRRVLTWIGAVTCDQRRPGIDGVYRAAHIYIKVNEADFIEFYNDMKTPFGYPWSATNDPDEIAFKIWRICSIAIANTDYPYVWIAQTPGETALPHNGDCEDKAILFFALMWKALDEIGKNLAWINSHVSVIYYRLHEVEYTYNWWLDKNGDTRIVDPTHPEGALPADIYGASLWTTADPTWIFCRTDQVGEYLPYAIVSENQSAMWYYNYFMQQTLNAHFADTTPDWCRPPPEGDARAWSKGPDYPYGDSPALFVSYGPGDYEYVFVKFDIYLMAKDATRYLNLFCETVVSHYWIQHRTFYIDVYEVTGPWDEATITWNNKPSLGGIIYSWNKSYDFGDPPLLAVFPDVYYKFTIPNAGSMKYGVCLVLRPETELVIIDFASKEHTVELERPFISRN